MHIHSHTQAHIYAHHTYTHTPHAISHIHTCTWAHTYIHTYITSHTHIPHTTSHTTHTHSHTHGGACAPQGLTVTKAEMVLHRSPEQLGFSRAGRPVFQTQWLFFRQPFPLACKHRMSMGQSEHSFCPSLICISVPRGKGGERGTIVNQRFI